MNIRFHELGLCAIALLAIISCNNQQSNSASTPKTEAPRLNSQNIKLQNILPKDKLVFGSGCETECDSFYVEFLDSFQAKLNYTHVYDKGGMHYYVKESESGVYFYSIKGPNEVEIDNNLWRPVDSVIVLSNQNYGWDNGYNIYEGYAILKSVNDKGTFENAKIYQWLDPTNYPSRNGEYYWHTSTSLKAIR